MIQTIYNIIRSASPRLVRLTRQVASLLLLALFAACSHDSTIDEPVKPTPSEPEVKENTYYITLNVTAPTSPATRASFTENDGTSSDETVAGVAKENSLVSAHIYFCDKDFKKVLAHFESEYVAPVDNEGKSMLRVKVEQIDALYDLVGQEDVQLLIVGNKKVEGNQELYNPSIDPNDISTATFSVGSLSDVIGDYGNDGKILPLVSAEAYSIGDIDNVTTGSTVEDIIKALFSRLTPNNAWWDVTNDKNNNNKVKPVKLERAVARIELRGNITPNTTGGENEFNEDWDYEIAKQGLESVKLRLYSVTPFNVNENSYLFRHTSEGNDQAWGGSNTVKMFGIENGYGIDGFTGYRWVASSWWTDDRPQSLMNVFSNTTTNYLIDGKSMVGATGNKEISEIAKRDRSEPLTYDNGYKGGYHPWCYVTENTLYSQDLMNGTEAENMATGVAFRFAVIDNNGKLVKYSDKDNLEFPLEIAWSTEPGKENYLEITNWKTGDWVQIAPDPTDGCYYLDYMALLIHNYNSSGMGPMFYGVVRNNTYQISISKLADLPHPNDPRSWILNLSINVLKWQQRENEFTW